MNLVTRFINALSLDELSHDYSKGDIVYYGRFHDRSKKTSDIIELSVRTVYDDCIVGSEPGGMAYLIPDDLYGTLCSTNRSIVLNNLRILAELN